MVEDAFSETLDGAFEECWRRLARGVADRRHPFHQPSIATIGLDGRPRQRVVVLRGVDAPSRTLRFHTDRRSEKVEEIGRDPRLALLVYDPGAKLQIRIEGVATLHAGEDAIARAAFAASQPISRLCYGTAPAPGSAIAGPDAFTLPRDPQHNDGAYENFVAVIVEAQSLEWLFLRFGGHRRARHDMAGGAVTGTWLTP